MTNINRRVSSIATGQLGGISREQARAAGASNAQLRRRVSSGILETVGTQTFRLPGAPTTPIAMLRSLQLDIGGDVWASGPTAAALHGFDGFVLTQPFDVVVMRGRNIARVGHRVHTTKRLDLADQAMVDGVAVLSGARTVIDLARSQSIERLMVAVDSGLRDGKFNESFLHRRIISLASSGRHGIPKLLDAINTYEHGRGGHSWLERRFLQIVSDAGLARPITQEVLSRAQDRVVRVDFRFPGTDVVVEVLGYRYHRTTAQIERDAARMNALVANGFRVLQFTYSHVVESAESMLDELRSALA